MLIAISKLIRADHEEVEGVIREGFGGIGKDGVGVQVLATRSPQRFTGRAWAEPPRRRSKAPETRWLVEIVMPSRPPKDDYPLEWRYPHVNTAPTFVAQDWRDRLFAVVQPTTRSTSSSFARASAVRRSPRRDRRTEPLSARDWKE